MKFYLTNDEVFQMLASRLGVPGGRWVMHIDIDPGCNGGASMGVEFEPYDQKLHQDVVRADEHNAPPLLRLVGGKGEPE